MTFTAMANGRTPTVATARGKGLTHLIMVMRSMSTRRRRRRRKGNRY